MPQKENVEIRRDDVGECFSFGGGDLFFRWARLLCHPERA